MTESRLADAWKLDTSVYMPILKGRRAEFSALRHVAEPVSSIVRPLLEVLDEETSVHGSSLRFAHLLMDSAPKDMIFAVDCRYLRPDCSGRPLQRVAQAVHEWGITMIPVFSPGDRQDPADVRVAADLHKSGVASASTAHTAYLSPPAAALRGVVTPPA
jgi:hypothetical protein